MLKQIKSYKTFFRYSISFLICCLFLLPFLSYASTRSVIIDTDLGTDDFQAIVLLLNDKDINIKAITVLADGEDSCGKGTAQLRKLLKLANQQHIPSACSKQENQEYHLPKQWGKQMDWFSTIPVLSYNHRPIQLILRILRNNTKPVSIVALAPLTHLAAALKQAPSLFKRKVQDIYFTGGRFLKGHTSIKSYLPNFTNDQATWNILINPQAFDTVLNNSKHLHIVAYNTYNNLLLNTIANSLKSSQTAFGKFIFNILKHNTTDWFVGDQVTALLAIHPTLCNWKTLPLKGILKGPRIAETIIVKGGKHTRVCLDMSQHVFTSSYLKALRE